MVFDGTEADEVLMADARSATSGDIRAFDLLMARHQSYVLANCRYLTGSAEDAHDLAQEVFVKVYFALAKFEGRSKFKTWLSSIKVNHCLNFLRKHKGKSFVDVHSPALEPEPALQTQSSAERDLVARTRQEAIQQILDSLPDTLRIPLVMRDVDGYTYQEIAETLDIGLSAVKMRIKRARAEFRERYEIPMEPRRAKPSRDSSPTTEAP